jgi:hypothetical protein
VGLSKQELAIPAVRRIIEQRRARSARRELRGRLRPLHFSIVSAKAAPH